MLPSKLGYKRLPLLLGELKICSVGSTIIQLHNQLAISVRPCLIRFPNRNVRVGESAIVNQVGIVNFHMPDWLA